MTPGRWRRVTEIFHAARAIPDATARDAYLRDACEADLSLRGDVEALLGADEDAGSFGEQPMGVGASGVGQLAPGSTLGPYQIEGLIDVGGMGEVYRAHDTALNRDVAIKVLPDGLGSDPDRLMRFEREAQTLAALNHPNIAHVYGLERSGDTPAIVMELVEGPTLADRIGRGPIPVDEALPIAHQIAEGLEAAHERGVIHRDLKPANIKLGDDGAVKLLDFGLAKAFAPDGSAIAAEAMDAPTDTSPAMTQPGVILGTAAYMAPEQARGKPVDKRVDVWAFGAVLYEMLTGRRCFDGHTVTDVLAAVVKSEPDWDALPPETPDAVRRLLGRCLTKDVKERLHDIGDARLEVDAAVSEPTALSSGTSAAYRPPALQRAFPVIAAVAATVLGGAVAVWVVWPARGEQPVRFTHIISTDHVLRRWGRPVMAVSRDGRQVVYNIEAGLYRFTMDDTEARLIPGTEGDLMSPFFSPDGQSVGYYDPETRQLMRIGIGGGASVPICSAISPFEVSWEADGTILFAQQDGIHRVPSNGGPAQVLIAAGQGERLRRPQLLPDGDSVLFTVIDAERNDAHIVVQSIRTAERTPLGIAGRQGRYLSTGHIIYGVEDALYLVPFDADRLVAIGTPVPVEQNVGGYAPTGVMFYEISENGTLVYLTGDYPRNERRALVWVSSDGVEEPIAVEPGSYWWMNISPSGAQVLVDRLDATGDDIRVLTLSSGVFDRLRSTTTSRMGLWTPDNRALVYALESDDGERRDLYVRPVDGSAEPELFAEAQYRLYPASWTGDGKLVAVRVAEYGNPDLVLFNGARSAAQPLVETEHLETRAQVSPDGQWLAYVSDHTGSRQVFIQPIAEAAGRTPVSPPSSDSPRWAPDGQAIFYTHDGFMWSAGVTFTPTLTVSREPERLFPTADYYIADDYAQGLSYDVHPRTGEFLMLKRLSQDPVYLVVTVNWFERARQLASGG